MKELSIEQKAKAYDEAIEKAEKALEVCGTDKCETARQIFSIFPELRESEDERIRKALINGFNKLDKGGEWFNGITNGQILAWLEKQEPQKTSIWKHWKDGIAGNGEGKPIYLIKDGYTYSLSSCLCFECDYIELSELDKLMLEKGEQKPVEWREEDEEMCQETIDWFEKKCFPYALENDNPARESIKWLKSLKGRVQPQPKQWLGEEDETSIAINNPDAYKIGFADGKANAKEEQWKPSDEQIGVIEAIINNRSFQRRHLDSLYEQLKKLKE